MKKFSFATSFSEFADAAFSSSVLRNRSKVRIFKHYISISILFLVITEIAILYLSYYLGTGLSLDFKAYPDDFSPIESKNIGALIYSLTIIISFFTLGLFRENFDIKTSGIFLRLLMSFCIGIGITLLALEWLSIASNSLNSKNFLLTNLIAFGIVYFIHFYFFSALDRPRGRKSILVIGSGSKSNAISRIEEKSEGRNFIVHGYIKCDRETPIRAADELLNLDLNDLSSYVMQQKITEIVVAPDDRRLALPVQQLLKCRMSGVHILDLCSFLERETGKIMINLLQPSWLIFNDGFHQNNSWPIPKRVFDLVISALLLLFFSPVILITMLAIWIDSKKGDTIFYLQTRVGLNGKPFKIIKFRSMLMNAENEGCPQWAEENDHRITRVGKIIRKFRIDELPQLLNVLKGDMRIVGPRPERPEFINQLCEEILYYNERHRVKPGITGWAQLNYPYGASVRDALEKFQYDLYYVKNNSFFLDLAILLQTAEVILFKKGSR